MSEDEEQDYTNDVEMDENELKDDIFGFDSSSTFNKDVH